MARLQGKIEIDKATWDAADKMLARIEMAARGNAISAAIRNVGRKIVRKTKTILPKPGYPGDKEGMTPLRETLKAKVENYNGGATKVGVTGYTYSNQKGVGGNHGHLLEGGHEKWLWGKKIDGEMVPPYQYLINVVEQTKSEQKADLVEGISKALARAAKSSA